MVKITAEQIKRLAPNVRSVYAEAFRQADDVLAHYGVNDNRLRLCHFMAQVLHETGGLTVLVESMNYSAPRIVKVWPKRFHSEEEAAPYAHNPQKLANKVYGGRMGNTRPGDGWRFIGRGLLQITGRESYEKYGSALRIDLAGNPDTAFDPAWALKIAAEEWVASDCNRLADADDVRRVTIAINNGTTGLAERTEWLAKTKHVWPR
jgi:putative chitinase